MKKMFLMVAGLLALFGFVACNMDSGSDNNESESEVQKNLLLSQIEGTNWIYDSNYEFNIINLKRENPEEYSNDFIWRFKGGPDAFIYSKNKFILETELPENSNLKNCYKNTSNPSLYYVDYDYYNENCGHGSIASEYSGKRKIYKFEWNKKNNDFFTKGDTLYIYLEITYNLEYAHRDGYTDPEDFLDEHQYTFSSYRNGYGPQDDNSDDTKDDNTSNETENTSSFTGTYAFNTASGIEKNGSVTLKDGEWSYTGEKTDVAASSGTYTVDGSKITVKWTGAGYDTEETLTVSTSGGSSKWTSDGNVSSLFSMLFGVVGREMTFDYSASE